MNPPEPLPAASGERPWQEAYLRYRELERQFTDDVNKSTFLVLLHAAAQGRRIFDQRLSEYRAVQGNLPVPLASLVGELQALADLRSSYNENAAEFVFDDVYHLAFDMLTSWRTYGSPIPLAPDCLRLHRGQAEDTWDVGASIYRVPHGPGREAALRDRASAACRVGHAIAARLRLPFVDAMAVAQHFGHPRGVNVAPRFQPRSVGRPILRFIRW